MKTQYEKQAEKFLTGTKAELEIKFLKNDFHFSGDKEKRDIYKCTLKRGGRKYSFNFGNSLNDSGFKIVNKNGKVLRAFNVPDEKRSLCMSRGFGFSGFVYLLPFPLSASEKVLMPTPPNCYDILACLTKYNPDTFENFCSEFGYDTDSRAAKKTYKAVKEEYYGICALFTSDEMELMAEIN